MTVPGILLLLASAVSLALGAVGLARRPRGRLQWSFAIGMLLFSAEASIHYVLLARTETLEDRLLWVPASQIAGTILVIPWAFFVAALLYPDRMPWRIKALLGTAVTFALASGAALVALPAFAISDIPGPFYAVRLAAFGHGAVIVQLLISVGILAGLESCLRSSRGAVRWRVKYLLVGLAGIFLVRFYFLSQVLLFQVVMGVYLPTQAGTLVLGEALIAFSLLRDPVRGGEFAVSRQVFYRSVVAAVLGTYLLGVGALGWLFTALGIAEELLWGSLVLFASSVALAVLLLSEDLRWRVKRYISANFYRSKYDYREQWTRFTKRFASIISIEQLAPELLHAIADTAGASSGAIYLVDENQGRLCAAASVGRVRPTPTVPLTAELRAALLAQRAAFQVGAPSPGGPGRGGLLGGLAAQLPAGEGTVIIPLTWGESLNGLLVIGAERTGAPWTLEDLELLGTVAEQATGALVTARLSEKLAQSREFETFHRLTSFVIHDLKNAISALSLLSHNAQQNFDDPAFQRDALTTLSRTVERMRGLLGRLSSRPEAPATRTRPVDFAALVGDTLADLKGFPTITLVQDLQPIPVVRVDREAMQRVIQNLVTNAMEAIAGEGTVTIRTYEDGGRAVLTVSDTGCGIPEDFVRKSLFAPFRSTKPGGWGIGLYQVKGIVEGSGGTIEVDSKPGSGTTFRVTLPGETHAA